MSEAEEIELDADGAQTESEGGSKKLIQVISRAAMVLRILEDEPEGLTLSQISQRVKLARSTVQRIVDTLLTEHFLIAATPTSGVRLGPALIRLAASASIDFDLISRPVIADLSSAVGETVDISVLKGHSAVFVDQVQGSHRLRAVSAIGDSFPLYCTANGKALMGVLPEDKITKILRRPLTEHTPKTITDRAELISQIEDCRRTGVAFDNEEYTLGISAVGTAFLDPVGRAVAISIPVPTTRFSGMRKSLVPLLLSARSQILEALGLPQMVVSK